MKTIKLTSCLLVLGLIFDQALLALDNKDDIPFLSLTRTEEWVSNLPTNVTVITADKIQEIGAKTLDEVLPLAPSVEIFRSGYLGSFTTVRLRGVPSSSQVQVLVDDQPLGGISIQFVDLSQIPTDNIDRIEIIRGGSSVLYGANAIGGIINIRTKKQVQGKVELKAGFEGRSFQTKIGRFSAGAGTPQTSAYFAGSRFLTDGFQQNSDASQTMGSGSFTYKFLSGTQLGADFFNTKQDAGNPHGTAVPISEWNGKKERAAADPNDRIAQNSSLGRLHLSHPINPNLLFYVQGFGSKLYYVDKNGTGFNPYLKREDKIVGGDSRLIWDRGLTVGGAYEWDGERMQLGSAPLASFMANQISNYAFYVEENAKWRNLRMIPAVRYDHHSAFGGVTNPRLSLIYYASDFWSVTGNASRSFRAPNFNDLYYQGPGFKSNPNLKPETAWAYDLGSRFRLPYEQVFQITGFFTRLENRITFNAARNSNLNAPKAEMSGVEAEWSGPLGTYFHQEANYTFTKAKGNSIYSSQFIPIRLTPRHLANYIITWSDKTSGWYVDTILQYASTQFTQDNEQGLILPSHSVWDVKVGKTFKLLELYLGIKNLADKRYAESFDFHPITYDPTINPQPGRTYYGGVNVKI